MKDVELIGLLVNIGFSQVEANVYLALLKESPLTGYKIASIISKSRSNVYQALKSLEQKGAVVKLQGGRNMSYKAVSVERVLQAKERKFQNMKSEVIEAFKNLNTEEGNDEIYNLQNMEQVYAKTNDIIRNTKRIIFVETPKILLPRIKKSLLQAVERGVTVTVYSDDIEELEGCDVIKFAPVVLADQKYNSWPIDWFCAAADGSEFIIATTRNQQEELVHALYSCNKFIAGWIYSDMLYQIGFNFIFDLFKKGFSRDAIWHELENYVRKYVHIAPGIKELKEKYKKI